jgi:integrase
VPFNAASVAAPPAHTRDVPMPWSLAEGDRFMQLIEGERDEALYTLALLNGPRQGELLALRWEHLDLERGFMSIAGTLTWVDGSPYVGPPKSEAGTRTVAVPAPAVRALLAWRERQDVERAACPSEWWVNDLVFARSDGAPRRGSTVTHQFHDLTSRLGMPQVRFHDLRRWFATFALTATNGNVHAVGASMGHSRKSNLALDVYGALTPEVAKMVANGIEGLLQSTGLDTGGHTPDAGIRRRLSSNWSSDQQLSGSEEPVSRTDADIAQR